MGNKLISCSDPYQKTEGILSKAGFTEIYAFFLRLDSPFQHRAALPSVIVSGLSQAAKRLGDFCRQNEDYVKAEG